MEVNCRAIVLRRRDAGEADRRLTLLTDTLGKVEAVAKGARKAGARLAGVSEPLSVASMTLATGKRTRYVVQAQPEFAFRGLRADYDRLTMALALAEVMSGVLPWEEPQADAIDLLSRGLREVETHAKPVVAFLWAQVSFLVWSGFMPRFDACVVSGDPIVVDRPWVAPSAGGLLGEAAALAYTDRFRVRFEVPVALSRLGERDAPPEHVNYAQEAIETLVPFWRAILEGPAPALESAVQHLRHGS